MTLLFMFSLPTANNVGPIELKFGMPVATPIANALAKVGIDIYLK